VKTLIICSSHFADRKTSSCGFEVDQLIRVSKRFYDKYYLVYPPLVQHHFHQSSKVSHAYFDNDNISDATSLIVRSTSGCEEATRLLVLNLYSNQCELLDPLERFHGSTATKSFMTIKGLKDQTIPTTFIAFTFNSAMQLLTKMEDDNLYPLVGKPTNGKQGKDVQLIRTTQQAKKYIQSFFKNYCENSTGIIFQKYIEIKKEYRVLLLDGHSLGIVEKMSAPKTIARNARKGSKFIKVDNEKVEQYAVKYNSNKGLLGADIAVDKNDECFLIESNRSPQWLAFAKATKINVAEKIMLALEKRIAVSSELF
jgi:glutathione synthase/RimK-type ligase-like ATP-grasp enzyme